MRTEQPGKTASRSQLNKNELCFNGEIENWSRGRAKQSPPGLGAPGGMRQAVLGEQPGPFKPIPLRFVPFLLLNGCPMGHNGQCVRCVVLGGMGFAIRVASLALSFFPFRLD
jgi:hypothetical protein